MNPCEGGYNLRLMKGLTARQRQVLDFIVRYRRQYGRSPSLREIARALGLRSHSTVYRHLQRIQKKGYLEWQGGRRGALPVDACADCLRIPVWNLQELPPYGAGTPVRFVELPRWLLDARVDPDRLFALPGRSLGLPEGLVVLERNPQTLRPGDAVLCYRPEAGIGLQRVRRQGTRLFLQDADHGQIPLDRPDARPLVLGRVVLALLTTLPEAR